MPTSPVEIALLFSTGLVAFVFLLSGASKLRTSEELLEAMQALDVPLVLQRRWVAIALPMWEVTLGVALVTLPGIYRALAAVAAFATLAVFTFYVARVLRRGEPVDCGCFGSLSFDNRISAATVVRNCVLVIATALIVLCARGSGVFVVELFTSPTVTLLSSALGWSVLAVGVLLFQLIRLRRGGSESLPIESPIDGGVLPGDPIPDAELVGADGVTVNLRTLGRGSPVLLIFLSAECTKCAQVASRVPHWQQRLQPIRLHVATSSRPDAIRDRIPEVLPFARFGAKAANRALGAQGLPAAVFLGGLQYPYVASPIAHRLEDIEALVDGIVEARQSN